MHTPTRATALFTAFALAFGLFPAAAPAQTTSTAPSGSTTPSASSSAYLGKIGLNFNQSIFLGGPGDQRATSVAVSGFGGPGSQGGQVFLSGIYDPSGGNEAIAASFTNPPGPQPTWTTRWPTLSGPPAPGIDQFLGVAATWEGVYFPGTSYSQTTDSVGGKENKSILAKYPLGGSSALPTWVATPHFFSYQGVESLSAATPSSPFESGGPYIYTVGTGQPCSDSAYYVAKYDSSGNLLAQATDSSVGITFGQCSVPSAGGSSAGGVAVTTNTVIVAGSSDWAFEDSAGRPTLWIYDTQLRLLVRVKDNQVAGAFNAVSVNSSGILAVGYSYTPGVANSENGLIESFDLGGHLVNRQSWGGAQTDILTGVASQSNCGPGQMCGSSGWYVTGYTRSFGSGGADMVLLHVGNDGRLDGGDNGSSSAGANAFLFGGTGDDIATGIACDGFNVYISGYSNSPWPMSPGNTPGQSDAVLLCLSQQWNNFNNTNKNEPNNFPTQVGSTLYGGAVDLAATSIAVNAGRIIVGGHTGQGKTDCTTCPDEALAIAYSDPLGANPLWTTQWPNPVDPPAPGPDIFMGSTVLGSNIVLGGFSYSQTTDTVGTKEVKGVLVEYPQSGAISPLHVTATNVFPYQGVEAYAAQTTAVSNGTTSLYAVGAGQISATTLALAVAKFDTSLNLVKTASDTTLGLSPTSTSGPAGWAGARAVVAMGDGIVAAGSSNYASDGDVSERPTLWRFDSNLNLVWKAKDSTVMAGCFQSVAVLGGYVYASGYTFAPGVPDSQRFLFQKYDSSGNLVWSRTDIAGGDRTTVLGSVTLGSRLFHTGFFHALSSSQNQSGSDTSKNGFGGDDAFILEADPATGQIVWYNFFGGSADDEATAIATDGRDLFITGQTRSFAQSGSTTGVSNIFVAQFHPPINTLDELDALYALGSTPSSQVTTLEAANAALTQQVQSLTTIDSALTSQVQALTAANASLMQKVQSLTALDSSLSLQVQTLTTANTSLTAKVAYLTTQNTSLTAANLALTQQVASLSGQLVSLQATLAKLQPTTAQIQAQAIAAAEMTRCLSDVLTFAKTPLKSRVDPRFAGLGYTNPLLNQVFDALMAVLAPQRPRKKWFPTLGTTAR